MYYTNFYNHFSLCLSYFRANLISIDEMISVMRSLQTIPDETKLNTIMHVLDTDQDGVIDINDAIEVCTYNESLPYALLSVKSATSSWNILEHIIRFLLFIVHGVTSVLYLLTFRYCCTTVIFSEICSFYW